MRFNDVSSTSLLLLAASASANSINEQQAATSASEIVSNLNGMTQQTTETQNGLSTMNCDNVDSDMVVLFDQLTSLGNTAARNTGAPTVQARSNKLFTWVGSGAAHAKMEAAKFTSAHSLDARAVPASVSSPIQLSSTQETQVCTAALTFYQSAINMAQTARGTRDTLAPCIASARPLATGLTTAGDGINNFGSILTAFVPGCSSQISAAQDELTNSLNGTITSLGGTGVTTVAVPTTVVADCAVAAATPTSAFSLANIANLLGLGSDEPQSSAVACATAAPVDVNAQSATSGVSQGNGLLGLNFGGVNGAKRDEPAPYYAKPTVVPAPYEKPTVAPAPYEKPTVEPSYYAKPTVAPYYAKPTSETPYVAPVASSYVAPVAESPYVAPVASPYYSKPAVEPTVAPYVAPVASPYYSKPAVKPTVAPYVAPVASSYVAPVASPYYSKPAVKPTVAPYYSKPAVETPYVAPVATSEYAVPTVPADYVAPVYAPYDGENIDSSSVLVIAEPTATVVPTTTAVPDNNDDNIIEELLGGLGKRQYSTPVVEAPAYYSTPVVEVPSSYYADPALSSTVLVVAEPTVTVVPTATAIPDNNDDNIIEELLGGIGKRYYSTPVVEIPTSYYADPAVSSTVLVVAEPTVTVVPSATAIPVTDNNNDNIIEELLGGIGKRQYSTPVVEAPAYYSTPVVEVPTAYYADPAVSSTVLIVAEPTVTVVPTATAIPVTNNNNDNIIEELLGGIGKRYYSTPVVEVPASSYYVDPVASSTVLVVAEPTVTTIPTETIVPTDNVVPTTGNTAGQGNGLFGLNFGSVNDAANQGEGALNTVSSSTASSATQGNGALFGLNVGGVNGLAERKVARAFGSAPSASQGNGLLGLNFGGVNGAAGQNLARAIPGVSQGNGALGVNFGGTNGETDGDSDTVSPAAKPASSASQGNGLLGLNFAGTNGVTGESTRDTTGSAPAKQGNGLLGLNFAGDNGQTS